MPKLVFVDGREIEYKKIHSIRFYADCILIIGEMHPEKEGEIPLSKEKVFDKFLLEFNKINWIEFV